MNHKEHNNKDCIKCRSLVERNGRVCCRWCCKEDHDHIDCTDSSRCHCSCHDHKEQQEESRFEAVLAIFIDFVEEEARRIDEERRGARRRDGGRMVQCSIFLRQLLSQTEEHIYKDVEEKFREVWKLDHYCKCENEHFVSLRRDSFDSFLSSLRSNKETI